MKLKITTTSEILVPKGTKVIRNDGFITLARKDERGNIDIFTCPTEEIFNYDLLDEWQWMNFNLDELMSIIEL